MDRSWSVVFVVCIVILAPITLAAQGVGDVANNPSNSMLPDWGFAPSDSESVDAFGIGSQWTVIHASRWAPWGGSGTPLYGGPASGYVSPAGDGDSYWAQIDLPAGAVVTSACFVVRDDTAVGEWSRLDFHAYESAYLNPDPVSPYYTSFGDVSTGVSDTPGFVELCVNGSVTIRALADLDGDGDAHHVAYAVSAETGGTASMQLALFGAAIYWHRSISPAPATATFKDVPTGHWAFPYVEALVDSGVTAGCGSTTYCPDSPLTRAQMAVFLAKGLGLHWAQ